MAALHLGGPPARATEEGETTIAPQRIQESACFGACPEWLALKGPITKATPGALRTALAARPKIRVLLINSPGGDVASAEAIGSIIRSRKLDVIVASTRVVDCFELPTNCQAGRLPEASVGPGVCASACVQVLASGVNRAVWDRGGVGVHRFLLKSRTEITRRYRVLERTYPDGHRERTKTLTKETTNVIPLNKEEVDDRDYASTRAYFRRMGIDAALVDALVATPHAAIRRLTRTELKDWRMVTTEDPVSVLMAQTPTTSVATIRATAGLRQDRGRYAGPPLWIELRQGAGRDEVTWTALLLDETGGFARAPYTVVVQTVPPPVTEGISPPPLLVGDNRLAGGDDRPGSARLADFCRFLSADSLRIDVRPEHPAAKPVLTGYVLRVERRSSDAAEARCNLPQAQVTRPPS